MITLSLNDKASYNWALLLIFETFLNKFELITFEYQSNLQVFFYTGIAILWHFCSLWCRGLIPLESVTFMSNQGKNESQLYSRNIRIIGYDKSSSSVVNSQSNKITWFCGGKRRENDYKRNENKAFCSTDEKSISKICYRNPKLTNFRE